MKRTATIRKAVFLFVLAALMALVISALGEGEYRLLQTGSYGNDVVAVKERLRTLGYFTGSNFNNRYTDDTADRVRRYQKDQGLPQTGILTPAIQSLLFTGELGSEEAFPYRIIDESASGDDVLRLKEKLKALGFFDAKAETGNYNATLAEAIKAYQQTIGQTPNGIANEELQQILFGSAEQASFSVLSAGASGYVAVPTPAPAVTASPTTTPVGPFAAVQLPSLNAEGFLADDSAAPFVHADRDDGHWYYITHNLSIEIIRMQNKRQNITWFETEIRCTADSLPQAFLAKGSREDGHNYLSPTKIGEQYGVILGISDDFYGYRWYNRSNGLKQGVIIRNGEIKADEPQPASSKKWPYLEILALFNDGSMRTFESDEYTAKEYIDMGVIDTFAFGPILIHDGIIDQGLYDKTVLRYTDDEPRMALGCIEPYHYIIVTAKGRTSDSQGVSMHWLAERMKALGCENALNLDGGGTVALYFMGDVLNKVKNSTNLRDVSSMFGFSAP